MIKELIIKNRTCRRFHQDVTIDRDTLTELIELARLSPSASNIQPLRYILVCDPEKNEMICSSLGWAGYLKDWPGPQEGEKPSAYIVMLADTQLAKNIICDHGIACQSILLGAVEKDLAGCILASVDRDKLRAELAIDQRYDILLVIALGKPKETVVIDPVEKDGDIKYWRDADGIHHVPKRGLDDLIIG
jgi:nitroreductase